jgi:hypothetical protein
MTQHIVRYTVKPDQAAHNEELIEDALAELDRVRPAGFRYAVFKLADGVSFIHLVSHDTEKGPSPMRQLPALQAFHAGIRERCNLAPVRTQLSEIGSYRPFGEAKR